MKLMRRKNILLLLVLVLALGSLSACGKEPAEELQKYSETYWDYFDTAITLTAYCKSEAEFAQISGRAKELLNQYNQMFDIYNDYEGVNNVKTVNDNAGVQPVAADPVLLDLIEFSRQLYNETDGNVNVAFGAVLRQWHDVREAVDNGQPAVLPDPEALRAAAQHCNPEDIVIDRTAGTLYLQDPEMRLDLGAVAKGYATELVIADLTEAGYTGIVLSAGGNVRTLGTKPGSELWKVAVQNPDKDAASYAQVFAVQDMSVVTSGTYERFFELDSVRYHHIISKDSLQPENNYLSVTIVTENSGLADALSTAVFNMPLEEGMAFVNGLEGVEALWICNDGTQQYSAGLDAYIAK